MPASVCRRALMTKHQLGEQEVQIARYRILKQEVTDPLAAGLLHLIISELEADVQTDWEIGQRKCQGR